MIILVELLMKRHWDAASTALGCRFHGIGMKKRHWDAASTALG